MDEPLVSPSGRKRLRPMSPIERLQCEEDEGDLDNYRQHKRYLTTVGGR